MPLSRAHFATVIQAFTRGCLARRRHTVLCITACVDLVNGQTSTVSKRKMVWDADDGPPRAVARPASPAYNLPNMDKEEADAVDACIRKMAAECCFPLAGTRYVVTYDSLRQRWHVVPSPSSTYFASPVLYGRGGRLQPAGEALGSLFHTYELYASFTCELTETGAFFVRNVTDFNWAPGPTPDDLHDRDLVWSEPRDVCFDVPMGVVLEA